MTAYAPNPAIFRKAADIIRSQGLIKTQYGRMGSPRCAVGALTQAAEVSVLCVLPETRFLAEMLGLPPVATWPPIHYGMPDWSDTVGALAEAVGVSPLYVLPETQFLAEMSGLPPVATCPPIHYGVPDWSDRDDIGPADVITAFEQAAEKLEANR